MSKYNPVQEVNELKQILCNLISYIIWLRDNNYISDKTKDNLLNIINPEMKGGETNETRRYKTIK